MNKYLSDKLKAISFLLMGMVVFLHSYNLRIKFSTGTEVIQHGYNSFIQDFISQGVTRIAVPLFFAISGYLFFLNIKNGSISEFLTKYKKRSKSLVLPYLIWSIYGIILYLTLQSIPFSKNYFTNELIANYSFSHLISTIFINPIPYQLWFIRDLIILIAISPILYWLVKYLKLYLIILLVITWIYGFNYFIFSNEALLFFVLGALLSIKNINIQQSYLSHRYLIFLIMWAVLLIIKTYLLYINFENELLILILHKLSILIGIISIWSLYDNIFKERNIIEFKFFTLFQYTFFLYAFHEPILTIFKKAFYSILGYSEFSSFIIYVLAPTITIIISLLVGYYLKRIIPKFYYLLTGGR